MLEDIFGWIWWDRLIQRATNSVDYCMAVVLLLVCIMMQASHLIPIEDFQSGFTTCSALRLDKVIYVPLNDNELGVHKISSRTSHKLVTPPPINPDLSGLPSPTLAWEAFYPKGSINPSAPIPGGFGLYLSGPTSFAECLNDGAQEVVLSYRMMLEDGWEWVKGGKLPGICEW